jgi:NADH-quinone oxidoreductase subunit D
VTADIPPGWLEQCEAFLRELEPVIDEYHAVLTSNDVFIRRCAAVGVLSAAKAIDYGCTGPVLRGSGVGWDLRRDGEPCYTKLYEKYRFEVIAQTGGHYPQDHDYPPVPKAAVLGDSWHRFYVRMLEVVQSVELVRQAMDFYRRLPGSVGEPVKLSQKLPKGEAYLETEAPKGQMGFMVVGDGSAIPWRVRARSSSFCNLSVITELCRGCLIADVPAVLGSLDIVLGEIDR